MGVAAVVFFGLGARLPSGAHWAASWLGSRPVWLGLDGLGTTCRAVAPGPAFGAGLGPDIQHAVGGKMADTVEELRGEIERLRAVLEQIEAWSRAYPLSVFPKPDYKRVQAVLGAAAMTLDVIRADCMRHVVEEVGRMARVALDHDR